MSGVKMESNGGKIGHKDPNIEQITRNSEQVTGTN